MFVFSLRADRPKLVIILCSVVVLLLVCVICFRGHGRPAAKTDITCRASDAQERINFLSQFGWSVDEDPVEVSEVIIPSEFNGTYEEYNGIQKNQGFDLEPYKGKRAKRWVYEVKNYPGYAENSGCIRATLLIYDGLVIGGDVSSLEIDGFMQGFQYPDEVLSATTAKAG